ncbi:DUF4328 domain-containing protein [Streptomyces sp. NPDC051920]|uniref:DUF4328 domain-containing protein n=1 Tax=Streptomyces sp. NPDC051920 TaxID=3155523 RepID=UPI003414AA7B
MTMPPSPPPLPEGLVAPKSRARAATSGLPAPSRRPLPPLPPLQSPHGSASLRSPVALGTITAVLLGLVITTDLFAVWADYKLYDGRDYRAASFSAFAERVQVPVLLFTGMVFLIWFRRVRINAEVFLPSGHTWSRAWVIGSWFVPILNLWRPREIMMEIWDASRPAGTPSWRGLGLVNAWWTFLAAEKVISWLVRGSLDAQTSSGPQNAAIEFLILDSLDIVAAVLAILVVLRLTLMQDRKAKAGPAAAGG